MGRKLSAWTIVAGITLHGASMIARAAEITPATQPTAAATEMADLDTHWQDVLKGLGSAEFTEREAAQKELDRATFRDRDVLKRLAAASTDEEIKGRIMSRLEAIAEELALNPPPISLEMNNVSLADVATELARQLGTKVDAWPNNRFGPRAKTYTVSMKDKSFWEIFTALSKQHGIMLQGYNGMQFNQQDPGLSNGVQFGGMMVFPLTITRSKTSDLQQPPGNQVGGEQLSLNYIVAIDPRIKCLTMNQPEMTEVIDDAGNVLYKPKNQNQGTVWGGNNPCTWQLSTALSIPDKIGTKISSAKGQLKLTVILTAEKVEVTDVEKKLGQSVEVAGQTVVIEKFEVKDNQVNFNLTSKQGAVGRVLAGLNPGEQRGVQVTFIDSVGRRLWTSTLQGGMGGGVGAGEITPPVKIELSVPTKTKQVTLPFELKDLALP